MMKASRKSVTVKTMNDEEVKQTYIEDMSYKTAEQKLLESQKADYLEYLEKKVKESDFQFFSNMLDKLNAGRTLTGNMTAAIDRCIARDKEMKERANKPQEPVDESKLPKVTFKMKQWWTMQNKINSRVISGIVLRETQKAYLVKGSADMVEGTFCMRCGRELTEPASMLIGFGPDCCELLGIPYPDDVKTASEAKRRAIREQLLKVLHDQQFELWVPKSQIQEDLTELAKKQAEANGQKQKAKRAKTDRDTKEDKGKKSKSEAKSSSKKVTNTRK